MVHLPHSTIEQWGVLRAVVEHGGFAQAAAALHRSQSSVSYAVARLQETLGVALLEPQGRRAVLTEAGAALLAEAMPLIDELARLEERGRAIAGGGSVRLRVLVDTLFPKPRLFDALEAFALRYPQVEVSLCEVVHRTLQETADEEYDLAVLLAEPGARWTTLIADMPLLAVAAPVHPLAQAQHTLTRIMLSSHLRVEMREAEAAIAPNAHSLWQEGRVWRMNSVETAIEAVRRGLCYGWLPHHMIEADLDAGRLVRLQLASGAVRHIPLGLRFDSDSAGVIPAIGALAALLAVKEK
ncbi:LysR family transcriptional regulator [Azospirillum endophyticum]